MEAGEWDLETGKFEGYDHLDFEPIKNEFFRLKTMMGLSEGYSVDIVVQNHNIDDG